MFLRSAFSFCSASPPCLQGLFCPTLLRWWKAAGLGKRCQIPGRERFYCKRKGSPASFWVGEEVVADNVHHLSLLRDTSAEGTGSRLPFGNIMLMSPQREICWRCNNCWSNLWVSVWQAEEESPPSRFCFYILETKCVQNVFPHDFDFVVPNDSFHFEIHLPFWKVAFNKKKINNPKSKWLVSFQVEGMKYSL